MNRTSSQEIALRAEGLWFAYRETDWILKDICLSIPSGQITIIMGPSGTGKTTLLKILAGILIPSRGHVEVFNQDIANQSQRSMASLIGYIPQQLGLVRNLTALENVLMGASGALRQRQCIAWTFSAGGSQESRGGPRSYGHRA